MGGLIGVN